MSLSVSVQALTHVCVGIHVEGNSEAVSSVLLPPETDLRLSGLVASTFNHLTISLIHILTFHYIKLNTQSMKLTILTTLNVQFIQVPLYSGQLVPRASTQ